MLTNNMASPSWLQVRFGGGGRHRWTGAGRSLFPYSSHLELPGSPAWCYPQLHGLETSCLTWSIERWGRGGLSVSPFGFSTVPLPLPFFAPSACVKFSQLCPWLVSPFLMNYFSLHDSEHLVAILVSRPPRQVYFCK